MEETASQTDQLNEQDEEIIDFALQVLSPRWTSALLLQLLCGKKRTMELRKALPGVSAKTLSERLKRLQELGLVSRTVFPEVPPRVEYELTERGVQLHGSLVALKALGKLCLGGTNGNDKRGL